MEKMWKKLIEGLRRMVGDWFIKNHHYDPGGYISADIIHAVSRTVRKSG